MTIIQQLQDDIANEEVSLASILRRANILAYRLRHEDFKEWVDRELNDYPGDVDIPSYRRFMAYNFGDFVGPLNYRASNVPITVIDLDETIKDLMKEVIIGESVGVVEDLMNNPEMKKDGAIKMHWPHEAVRLASINTYQEARQRGITLANAWRHVGPNDVTRILETVRNKLLAFVLELQDSFPELAESDDKIGEVPPERITYMYNTYIHGNQNVVAAGTNIIQDVRQVVRSNDLGSLLSYLKSVGVSEEDAQELKKAVEEDGPAEEAAGFGPRVRDWLGKKAAEGALNATLSGIATTTAKAVAQYYGWLT